MDKNYKIHYWYQELKSHIECVNASQYKTILITGPHFYQVVTRVNNLTTKLWMEHVNVILKANKQVKIEQIRRVEWLTMQKRYRREFQQKIEDKILEFQQKADTKNEK